LHQARSDCRAETLRLHQHARTLAYHTARGAGGGLCRPHLRGSEGTPRQTRVVRAHFDFDGDLVEPAESAAIPDLSSFASAANCRVRVDHIPHSSDSGMHPVIEDAMRSVTSPDQQGPDGPLTAFEKTEAALRDRCASAEFDAPSFNRKVARCALSRCRGMCCYDGVYVDENTADVIQRLAVERAADFREMGLDLPDGSSWKTGGVRQVW